MSLKAVIKNTKTYEVDLAQLLVTKIANHKRSSILKTHGLSSIEWFILGMICNETPRGGIRVTDLATNLDVKTTYVTSVLRSLRSNGLVKTGKDPHDARVRLAMATVKARKTIDAIETDMQSMTEHTLKSRVTAEQYRSYIYVLQEIYRIHRF